MPFRSGVDDLAAAARKSRGLADVQFLSFPPADHVQEVIAIGRIGDRNNKKRQVSAEVLLAPAGWEYMSGNDPVDVQFAVVAVGTLPAILPHSKWKDGQNVEQPDRSVRDVGEVIWDPQQAASQNLSRLPETVSFSEFDDYPDMTGGTLPAHPIGNLAGLPMFRVLIDGRTAYVPVIELMRSAFMPDTFWARYGLENRWQSTNATQRAFGAIRSVAGSDGPIVEVEAFEHFYRHSAQPLALFGWQPHCLTSFKRLGGNLQSDIYIRTPAFTRTAFPFPGPTVWEFRSVRIAVRRPGRRPVEVEIVTRIFSIYYGHGIRGICLSVPKTVQEGSKPSRRPAEKPDVEIQHIQIEDEVAPSRRRASQDYVADPRERSSVLPVERRVISLHKKERTVALVKLDGPPAQLGSTADHARSDTRVAQVSMSETMEEEQELVAEVKGTLRDAVEAAAAQLNMRFAVVPSSGPDGRWLFPSESETKWNRMKVDARGTTAQRGFEVLTLVGQQWQVYVFDSVLTAYEKDQGSHARAAGLLRTGAAIGLDDLTIREIAQAWSDANGTWGKLKLFFDGKRIAPVGKVSHRNDLVEQVEAIVAKVQDMVGGR